jgi:chorismate-pyruvate lyase
MAGLDWIDLMMRLPRAPAFGALAAFAWPALAAPQLALPDALTRWRSAALIERIDADLLASTSATLTLERWCADHEIASPARILVEREKDAAQAPDARQRVLLGVTADAPVRYRKVRLKCGAHILSEAENWYVPERLTPAMNAALDGSDEPFGKVIRPLTPRRQTLALERHWSPVADKSSASAPCDTNIFSHEAIVIGGDGKPLALVAEHYKLDLICAMKTGD